MEPEDPVSPPCLAFASAISPSSPMCVGGNENHSKLRPEKSRSRMYYCSQIKKTLALPPVPTHACYPHPAESYFSGSCWLLQKHIRFSPLPCSCIYPSISSSLQSIVDSAHSVNLTAACPVVVKFCRTY